MAKDFRFGLGLQAARSQQSVQDWGAPRGGPWATTWCTCPTTSARPAPFPMLMAAAAATETLRMGTFVLNAGFYKPALLARDVACAARPQSGGRFELGLGAGYVQRGVRGRPNCAYPERARARRLPAPRDRIHGRAPARRAGADRGQRRPAADDRRAAGQHHRAHRRCTRSPTTSIRWPTASTSCAAPQATASTTWS